MAVDMFLKITDIPGESNDAEQPPAPVPTSGPRS